MGTGYVPSLELNTSVKVTFDPVVGLTGVFVRVHESASFGDVTVDLSYNSANSSCAGNSANVGVKVLHINIYIY